MNQNDAPLLKCENIVCQRGDQVLINPFSFSLYPGQVKQVIGPNGVGKSSLLRIFVGLLKPAFGMVSRTESCFYLGHDNAIKSNLTVFENLSWDVNFSHLRETEFEQALEAMGLIDLRKKPVYFLSQGQKRRLALARCYLSSAKLYVLDEPFSALDSVAKERVQHILLEKQKKGAGLVLTSHTPLSTFLDSEPVVL